MQIAGQPCVAAPCGLGAAASFRWACTAAGPSCLSRALPGGRLRSRGATACHGETPDSTKGRPYAFWQPVDTHATLIGRSMAAAATPSSHLVLCRW